MTDFILPYLFITYKTVLLLRSRGIYFYSITDNFLLDSIVFSLMPLIAVHYSAGVKNIFHIQKVHFVLHHFFILKF